MSVFNQLAWVYIANIYAKSLTPALQDSPVLRQTCGAFLPRLTNVAPKLISCQGCALAVPGGH